MKLKHGMQRELQSRTFPASWAVPWLIYTQRPEEQCMELRCGVAIRFVTQNSPRRPRLTSLQRGRRFGRSHAKTQDLIFLKPKVLGGRRLSAPRAVCASAFPPSPRGEGLQPRGEQEAQGFSQKGCMATVLQVISGGFCEQRGTHNSWCDPKWGALGTEGSRVSALHSVLRPHREELILEPPEQGSCHGR